MFLLISSILGSRTAGPHTQFVQWFMEECVDCLEQGSRGSILQFMPFTTVSASRQGRGWPHLLEQRGLACFSRAENSAASPQSREGAPFLPQHRTHHEVAPVSSCLSVAGIGTGEGISHVQPQGGSGHHGPQLAAGPPGGCQSHCCTLRDLEWPQRPPGRVSAPGTSRENNEGR